ncbi:hypothetical protein BX600DRAFT_534937 [Xylariales sp. PMI_506]|nr:hypothetical protein BX600DRAFT_534937 [Xylariales sp. PMI_506]
MTAIEVPPLVTGAFSILQDHLGFDVDNITRWKGKGKDVGIPEDTFPIPLVKVDYVEEEAEPKLEPKLEESEEDEDVELEVDWTEYEPPTGLSDVSNINSEIIVQIVEKSIGNIKTRIQEEKERRKAEAEAEAAAELERFRRAQEAEAALEKEKEKENALETSKMGTEDITEAEAQASSSEAPAGDQRRQSASFAGMALAIDPHGMLRPLLPPAKSKKRYLMGLLKRLNNVERGESSSMGAALWQKQSGHRGSTDLFTAPARKLLQKNGITGLDSSSTSLRSSVHEEPVECVSCLDDFEPKEMVKGPCHSYCQDCFQRLISTACENESQWPPKCCLNTMPERTVLDNVPADLQATYREKAEEWNIPVSDRLYCGHAACTLWIRPVHANRAQNTARCPAGHLSCTICRGPQHGDQACPQDRDLLRTEELAEEEGWKRCIGCHAYVEHREACQHMTCRCGSEFCYVCGARWRTCGCTMEHLGEVKRQAAVRRRERQAREAEEEARARREAAEVAEALRQVEEFEREEALKAELLRQEQERIAEERRQRELEERIRKEGARRQAVEGKFQELHEVLGNLHELQRVAVTRDHSKAENIIKYETGIALSELRTRNKVACETIMATTKAKLAERDMVFKSEYTRRLKQERLIEEEYHRQLKDYWSDQEDGEREAAVALRRFQREMDAAFFAWSKWSNTEVETYRYHVNEEENIQLELMQAAESKLASKGREKRRDFLRLKTAELKWVEAVVLERESLIHDMEVDEIENGEDVDAWFAEGALDDYTDSEQDQFPVPGAFK